MKEEKQPYNLMMIRNGLSPKTTGKKERKPIKKISDKLKAEREKEKVAGGDNEMDLFFERMRKRLTGICQCGCTRKSSKNEDDHYRASISHIFPKRIFKSIATNEYNWVERNFWDGCHSNTDNRSMDLWVNFADWEDIKERFHILAPLLTDEERKHKFYTHLEKLIYNQ
jgi:hypothetical protein